MSLQTLRDLRLSGHKPAFTVAVVVGMETHFPEWENVIVVNESPERMDWRPVIGLPLAVFVADGAVDLGQRAFECALAAGCEPVGLAFRREGHSVIPEANPVLARMWEALCK